MSVTWMCSLHIKGAFHPLEKHFCSSGFTQTLIADFLLFKLATIDAWVNEIMWVVNPVNARLNTWPSIQFNEPLKNKEKWTRSRIYSSPKQPSARHSNRMRLDKRGCVATLIWPMLQTHFQKHSKSVHFRYIKYHGADMTILRLHNQDQS